MLIASVLQRQSNHLHSILDPTRSREEPLPLDLLLLLHLQTSHPFHSQYSNKSFTFIPLPFISSLSRGISRSNLSSRSVGKQGGGAGIEDCSNGTHELGAGSREDCCWNCWRRCLRSWDDGLRVQGGAGLCLSSTRLFSSVLLLCSRFFEDRFSVQLRSLLSFTIYDAIRPLFLGRCYLLLCEFELRRRCESASARS